MKSSSRLPSNGAKSDARTFACNQEEWVQSNAFLRRIPLLTDVENCKSSFSNLPPFSARERALSKAVRMAKLGTLETFFQTLERHYAIVNTLYACLITGYLYREECGVTEGRRRADWLRRNADDVAPEEEHISQDCSNSLYGKGDSAVRFEDLSPSSAPMASLFGLSGLGKTLTLKNALTFLPSVLPHPDGTLQVVKIYVQCSHDGQLKGCLKDILRYIDEVANTNYESEVGERATVEKLGAKVLRVCKLHYVGIIVLDEIQNGLVQKGVAQRAVLNFFVKLNNISLVPIFLLGTPDAKLLMKDTLYSVRRPARWGSFEWRPCGLNEEWDTFLSSLWIYQWTSGFAPLTPELRFVMHDLSQGIFGIATCLFQLAQARAIQYDVECLTPELLREVAAEELGILAPAIDALRTSDVERLTQYEDLVGEGLDRLQRTVQNRIDATTAPDQDSTKTRPASHQARQFAEAEAFLTEHFPDNRPETLRLLEEIWRDSPSLGASALVQKVHNLMLVKQNKRRRKRQAQPSTSSSRDKHAPGVRGP